MSFHVGQRVVCVIQGQAPSWCPAAQYPVKGQVYTVREVRDDTDLGGIPNAVLLFEVCNAHLIGFVGEGGMCHREPGFASRAFRPLSEARLDQFRQHLSRVPSDRVPA